MFIRGLKTKIAFNIAILFFVAMLLINIVTVMTAQREIIRREVSLGHFILSTLEADLLKSLNLESDPSSSIARAEVNRLLTEAGVTGALILGKHNERDFFPQQSQGLAR